MAEQFSPEWARGVIDDGVSKAQAIIDDPSQIEDLLAQVQEKLKELPGTLSSAVTNVPLMAQMVKSYVTREYTEVSPKVVVALVSTFLYLVTKEDLIADDTPIVGYADDIAVAAVAMIISEPELNAYAQWREQNAAQLAETAGEQAAEAAAEPAADAAPETPTA